MKIATINKIEIIEEVMDVLYNNDANQKYENHIELLDEILNNLKQQEQENERKLIKIKIKTKIGTYVSRKMERDYRYISSVILNENSKILNFKYGLKVQETEEHEEGERLITTLQMVLDIGSIFKVSFNKYEEVEGLDRKTDFYAKVTHDGYKILTPSKAVDALNELGNY